MSKIISIKINPNTPVLEIGGREVVGVIITTQSWLGKIKTFEAYPTCRGKVSRNNGSLLYVEFVDEIGEFLDEEISQQINNYLDVQKQLNAY